MVRIVYAGLLGVAQNLLKMINDIDFAKLDAELHIYGGGNQKEGIKSYIVKHPERNIYFHGYVEADQLKEVLLQYDAALIPLVTYIQGAVPSKIFDTIPLGLPIFFCGKGEGAEIVRKYRLGFVSKPDDAASLSANIQKFSKMTKSQRELMSYREKEVAREYFDYDKQMKECYQFIRNVVN